jgi:hypothetical protein
MSFLITFATLFAMGGASAQNWTAPEAAILLKQPADVQLPQRSFPIPQASPETTLQAYEATLPNEKQLEIFCARYNGKLIPKWTCPSSGVVRGDGPFCVLTDKIGRVQVTNGCTGTHGIGSQFFKACVLHDFCYHNHALLNGKTKASCDDKLLTDMYDMCDRTTDKTTPYTRFACYLLAQRGFYTIVKYFGERSWVCSNGKVEYPQSVDDI